jgi:hypothetical protein
MPFDMYGDVILILNLLTRRAWCRLGAVPCRASSTSTSLSADTGGSQCAYTRNVIDGVLVPELSAHVRDRHTSWSRSDSNECRI